MCGLVLLGWLHFRDNEVSYRSISSLNLISLADLAYLIANNFRPMAQRLLQHMQGRYNNFYYKLAL